MLRINTGIEAHTHEFVRTGGDNTKFGVPSGDLDAVIGRALGGPGAQGSFPIAAKDLPLLSLFS